MDAHSPFEIIDSHTGEDLRPRVQLMLNRWPSTESCEHFNITLINNEGVRKTPTESAEIDPGAAVSLVLRARAAQRHVTEMFVVEALDSAHVALRADGTVQVLIPPGGVVVIWVGIG